MELIFKEQFELKNVMFGLKIQKHCIQVKYLQCDDDGENEDFNGLASKRWIMNLSTLPQVLNNKMTVLNEKMLTSSIGFV